MGSAPASAWPEGSEVIPFENLDGVILVNASVRSLAGRDTSGYFVLDTGAGYLALDSPLAVWAGVVDSAAAVASVDYALRPVARLTLGALSLDQVQPVLVVDATPVQRVTDRAVLGLIGQMPLRDRAVWIDFAAGRVALIPAGPDSGLDAPDAIQSSRRLMAVALSRRAEPVPFRLAGDGKVLVEARLSNPGSARMGPWLTFIVDTGASKCVLFEAALDSLPEARRAWPTLRGLEAPTLIGTAQARIARVPSTELRSAPEALRVAGVDFAIIQSDLSEVLARATGGPVHGLIGYSLLKRYRVALDYPHRVLWLDPIPGYRDDRPLEYSHVGLQVERRADRPQVVAIATGSPAEQAGIRPGDEMVAVDGVLATELDVLEIARRMEGPPGSTLTLVLRRDDVERTYHLRRRRLL